MRPLGDIEARLAVLAGGDAAAGDAREMLGLAEQVLEHWVCARGEEPTVDLREGFRLLALHRQGSRELPSFNACRETCRELAWHFNLLELEPGHDEAPRRARMMALLANHLCLFVAGKLEVEQFGDFCCSAKPLRLAETDTGH